MKYVSLFAGIGGFDLALDRLGHECVYANDFDKYCKITYEKNFRRELDTRSITNVSTDEIPDHDILTGGFPCQAFSVAGKRRGFEDTRGTLFFEIARILNTKRPTYIFLENVKGLLNHQSGRTFETIMWTLDGLGYDVQWQVCNSKYYVPQNRERVFIIGNLRGTTRPKVFPITKNGTVPRETRSQTLPTLTANDWKGPSKQRAGIVILDNKQQQGEVREYIDITPTLTTKMGTGGNNVPLVSPVPLKFLNRNQRNFNENIMMTVDTAQSNGVRVGNSLRKLTPIECERLQGFPDNWTEGVSDTQRYKQLGNSVTVDVVYDLARRFLL